MKHQTVQTTQFPYRTFKKNLRIIYRTLQKFPVDLENPYLLSDYLRENAITSLSRELIAHVANLYKDDHLGLMVVLASYMTNLVMSTNVRLGRIFKVQLGDSSFMTISPLYMDSPRNIIEVSGSAQSIRMHLALRMGLPTKLVPEVKDPAYFEGLLVNYTVDTANKQLRLQSVCESVGSHNVRIFTSKLGRTSWDRERPCAYCKFIHNGRPENWCEQLKSLNQDPYMSVKMLLK